MRSSKSRSRSKSNRNRSVGNIVNRVFDSSGPEGKVRGTPQQIIEKYNQLARDAQLANDRVATENFQQHSEHYTRMLGEAQREAEARREQQEAQNRERQREREEARAAQHQESSDAGAPPMAPPVNAAPPVAEETLAGEPATAASESDNDAMGVMTDEAAGDSGLVETPESKPRKPRRPRKPRAPKPAPEAAAAPEVADAPAESPGVPGGDSDPQSPAAAE